ncbi:MAG: methyl-accepting chemotaxis protein [Pseudomonadota bacterium]
MASRRFSLIALSRLPLFWQLLFLIGLSISVVVISLAVMNSKTVNRLVDQGLRDLAEEINHTTAVNLGAALRFGNADAVYEALQFAIDESHNQALYGAALLTNGSLVAQAGDATAPIADDLVLLAEQAVETQTEQLSTDGFAIATPAFVGEGDARQFVGVIALAWTPMPVRAAAFQDKLVNWAISLAIMVTTLAMAALVLRRFISKPVKQMSVEIVALSEGQYDRYIGHSKRGDEIGLIAKNLQNLQRKLREANGLRQEQLRHQDIQRDVVETVSQALKDLSEGDLRHPIEREFAPEYEALRNDFNQTLSTIGRILRQATENSKTIRQNAEGIEQSTHELSRRTENQAASLEETAAALDMVTNSARESAEGAQRVEKIVSETKTKADESRSVVENTVKAMSEIETSSKQISQIISVIDDIAFQTNLLALNAGVEAARAGQAGRGFAVVATEVRALANRSSEAANEIKSLIVTSSQLVDQGVDLVAKTGNELQDIADGVAMISGHMAAITQNSNDQSRSLAEVNTGMAQLDKVTQQNAAMVNSSSKASNLLRQEADAMAKSISIFKLPAQAETTDQIRSKPPKLDGKEKLAS